MESILNNTQPIHVIPFYASVEEHALYTIASVEEAHTELCKAIGIYELSTVMEAEGKTSFAEKLAAVKNKIVSFFQEQWRKFQDLCDKARKKVESFVTEKYKSIAGKAKPDELKKAIEATKDGKWDAEYKALYVWKTTGTKTSLCNLTLEKTKDVLKKLQDAKEDTSKIQEIDVNEMFAQAIKGKVDIKAEDFGSASKIQSAIKDTLIKKNDAKGNSKDYFADAIGGYCKNLIDTPKAFKDDIKDPYNKTKKTLNDLISDIKKSDTDKAFSKMIAAATAMLKINSAVVGAVESATLRVFASQFRVVAKAAVIATVMKDKKEKANNESAVAAPEVTDETTTVATESSTFQTELASLFNF